MSKTARQYFQIQMDEGGTIVYYFLYHGGTLSENNCDIINCTLDKIDEVINKYDFIGNKHGGALPYFKTKEYIMSDE